MTTNFETVMFRNQGLRVRIPIGLDHYEDGSGLIIRFYPDIVQGYYQFSIPYGCEELAAFMQQTKSKFINGYVDHLRVGDIDIIETAIEVLLYKEKTYGFAIPPKVKEEIEKYQRKNDNN